MKRGWLALLWLLPVFGTVARAEVPATPQPRQLEVVDGLPSTGINAFAEDHLGYLWLASRDGLARFDGRNYRIWRAEDGLRDNLVWSLHVDAQNRLWMGTQSAGLVMLSADRRSFRYFDRDTLPQLGSNTIWSITSTQDGSVWFGTPTAGLYRLAADGGLRHFMPTPGRSGGLPSASVAYLAVTPDGVLWVGTKGGLARWTGSGFECEGLDVLPSPRINGLKVDREGRLWIATNDGVVVRQANGRFERMAWPGAQPADVLNMMQFAADGNYWLDTRQGLGRSRDGGPVRDVALYSVQERGRVRPNWVTAHEDRDGGLWFASTNAGLWHLPPNWRQFLGADPAPGRPGLAAQSLRVGAGRFRIGRDMDGGHPRRAGPAGSGDRRGRAPPAAVDGSNWPQSVVEDANGRVWIGSLDALVRYDPRDRSVRRWHDGDAADAAMPGDSDMLRSCNGGRLWVYSEDGGLQQRDAGGACCCVSILASRACPSRRWRTCSADRTATCGCPAPPGLCRGSRRHGASCRCAAGRPTMPTPSMPLPPAWSGLRRSAGSTAIAGMTADCCAKPASAPDRASRDWRPTGWRWMPTAWPGPAAPAA